MNFLYFWTTIICPRVIWYRCIIYFYILCQYSLTGLPFLLTAARTFLKIQTVSRHRIFLTRSGLCHFVKVKGISSRRD